MNERIKVVYRGHVQGVGFRFQTTQISRSFGVNGYVKNLSDGSVELVAEGHKDEIFRFMEAIQNRMADNIADSEKNWSPATGEFQSFSIAY